MKRCALSFSRLDQSPISRRVLLVALALTSVAFCNCLVAVAQQDDGRTILYEGNHLIVRDANGLEEYALAGTAIHRDSKGIPDFIGFSVLNEKGEWVWQGKYGVDGTGQPENKGRLIYRGKVMPYLVESLKTYKYHVYTYHLSYLELTTVGDTDRGSRAYATKAIASDNEVEVLGEGTITYKLPEGGQLDIVDGKIKIGDDYISPNYDLTGKIPVSQAGPRLAGTANAAPNIEMVMVKGGCYQMGDTFGDGLAMEKPVHQVCVDDFYIGKYLVTQAQWQAVMGNNPSNFKECGGNCPVEQVSWEDAQEYIAKLNKLTGRAYRLPSEAEWEYAARSGGKREEWAGTNDEAGLTTYAWIRDNSDLKTHPVGTRKPNDLGLYDMSGNVWEWCQDWYNETYYQDSSKKNPLGPPSGFYHVLRGGSWFLRAYVVRAAMRMGGLPSNPGGQSDEGGSFGLRLVLSTPP